MNTPSEGTLDLELKTELEYELTRDCDILAIWSDKLREAQENPHATPHLRIQHAKEIARLRKSIARTKRLLAWGVRRP